MKYILLAAALMTASCACGHAHHAPGHRHEHGPASPTGGHAHWELLGGRSVDPRGEQDAIAAGLPCVCRTIRIDVEGVALEMWDIKVHFANGEIFSPPVRHQFREGAWSRVIDLPGNTRVIRKIGFFYRTAPRGDEGAKVEAWGLH